MSKKSHPVSKKGAVRFKLVPDYDADPSGTRMQFVPKYINHYAVSQNPDIYRIFDDDYCYDNQADALSNSDDLDVDLDIDAPTSSSILDHIETASNPNVGESAKFGIFYDDRHYDYTQHLFASAVSPSTAPDSSLDGEVNNLTYENIKDCTAIDPDLAETLEALEDDAFNANDFEDDFFVKIDLNPKQLAKFQKSRNYEVAEEEEIDLDDPESFAEYCDGLSSMGGERCDYSYLRESLRGTMSKEMIEKHCIQPVSSDIEIELVAEDAVIPPKKEETVGTAKLVQNAKTSARQKPRLKIIDD